MREDTRATDLNAEPGTLATDAIPVRTLRHEDLIAHKRTVDEIREYVGADSLYYLTVDGMMRALKRTDGFCRACFTGEYPIPVDMSSVKTGFERVTK